MLLRDRAVKRFINPDPAAIDASSVSLVPESSLKYLKSPPSRSLKYAFLKPLTTVKDSSFKSYTIHQIKSMRWTISLQYYPGKQSVCIPNHKIMRTSHKVHFTLYRTTLQVCYLNRLINVCSDIFIDRRIQNYWLYN